MQIPSGGHDTSSVNDQFKSETLKDRKRTGRRVGFMKIESGRNVAPSSPARKAGPSAAASGFSPAAEAPVRTTAASSISTVTPLDAIIALQAEEGPAQRRARQARRGKDALDALEKLERGLLAGRAPRALLSELENLQYTAEPTGEAELDSILIEIDTRLAVEVAKLERMLGRP